MSPPTGSPGQPGQLLEVRTPDGSLYQRADERQARALVASRLANEVRSPSGKLRYLSLRPIAAASMVSTVAMDSLTTTGRKVRREHHRARSEAFRGAR